MSARVGILSFAHVHAPQYAAALGGLGAAEFVGVADDDGDRGREVAGRYGVRFFEKAGELFEAVDVVVVCSENRRHAGGVILALRAGVDVMCEKPISTTVEDAREMIRASEETGRRLGISFPVRHAPAVRRAREVVRSGAIGRVLAVNGTNHGQPPGGWFLDPEMSGGGAVMDQNVHVVDTLRFVLGVEVSSAYAEVGTFFGAGGVDDAGILTLEMEGGIADGAFATVDPSWSRGAGYPTWGDFTLRINGSSGVLDVDAFSRSISTFDHVSGGTSWTHAGGDPNVLMLDDFLRGAEGERIGAGGEDGLRALEVVLAAYSSGESHAPVAVARG
ncbi:Gfo/Idh/MocA family oxidoreductase [soil metagenome]